MGRAKAFNGSGCLSPVNAFLIFRYLRMPATAARSGRVSRKERKEVFMVFGSAVFAARLKTGSFVSRTEGESR